EVPGLRIGEKIQVATLNGNELVAIRRDDPQPESKRPSAFHSLIAGDHASRAIDQDRSASPQLPKRVRERLAAARRPAIRIPGIEREVCEPSKSRRCGSRL